MSARREFSLMEGAEDMPGEAALPRLCGIAVAAVASRSATARKYFTLLLL
jgi:hypothetical protein